MKSLKYIFYIALIGVVGAITSCEIDEIPDPNNADQNSLENGATLSDLQLLANGTTELFRSEIGFYYDVLGIIGREYYFFTNSDPRYTGEILGKEASTLDGRGFYGTRPYAGRYRTIKNANVLITATQNTSESLTAEEVNGILGFAKTIQAYEFLLVLNMQYQNGIRMDVSNPEELGGFVGYDAALQNISSLLDEANTHLAGAGAEFVISMITGMPAIPSDFSEFNRAIKARVELYRGNNSEALAALSSSFMDLSGTAITGASLYYSVAGTDELNPIFRTPDQSEALVAHPSFITDMQAGDTRINKVTARTATAVLDGLSGDYDVTIYGTNADAIPVIRNEELILIYAEANIGTDNAAAEAALNTIRNMHGLADLTAGQSAAQLMAEVMYNRRYSLFGEAHRWIDERRQGSLQSLPKDRAGDDIWEQFPRPSAEGS